MTGLWTLFYKELLRFWKVGLQTILSPLVTTLLYLLIFSHVLEAHVQVYPGVGYTAFLIPGLVMMAMLQNAFANSSSSLIQSKMSGNIVFLLLPPLAYWEFFAAYVAAAIVRGLVVGFGVGLAGWWFTPVALAHPLWMVAFALAGCAMLAAAGIITALWAGGYDQMAAVQNFIIMPLTFLSGVFYSIHSLPPFWQALSRYNPFFYLIDGFRYGFFGVSDVSPALGLAIVGACCLALSLATLALLKSGYKLRN
ncbi:MAG: ABC transporter permease [Sulfuricella sp.]|nr:ABC transporter permease [Sulfuricella sp.]